MITHSDWDLGPDWETSDTMGSPRRGALLDEGDWGIFSAQEERLAQLPQPRPPGGESEG